MKMFTLRTIFTRCLAVCVLFVMSCGEFTGGDFLEKTPDEDMTLEEVFSERRYAESFLTSAYFNLPEEYNFARDWGRNPYIGASDEMELTWTYPFAQQMNSGAWNAENAFQGNYMLFSEGLRKLNLFLENVDQVPMNEADKQVWVGEATFLRAFLHFWLARAYGPIPIIDKTFGTDADFSEEVKRAPIDQVVDFIVAESDKAAELLPMRATPTNYGRPTKAAALALKARALLYMASPLWNGNSDYSGFVNKEGEALFPDYDKQRWQEAAQAAKECIDQVEAGGYQLYYAADGDPMRSYQELFLVDWNDEVLFARTPQNDGSNEDLERHTSANGMGGWSGYAPTQEMVDAYQMEDGTQPIEGYNSDGSPIINPASGYQETGYTTQADPDGYYPAGIHNMYVDREPRFYASINFNGAFWRGRQLEFWPAGLDGNAKGGPDYTKTGYLMKKHSSPNVDIIQGRFEQQTWIYFRLGEQYLNYAEALNEFEGPVTDVYTYVNAIRTRAGLPDLPAGLSQDQMREAIRHERRIELAFETHRYFDTNRWKIAEETRGGDIHGMNINAGIALQDDSFYERTFVEKRVFESPKHYLFPFPQSEIDKNVNIVQNPGW